MKNNSLKKKTIFRVSKKRIYISVALIAFLTSAFVPVAFASNNDPWYIVPITWTLDLLLGVLGGIHDPMDHVFYNGCGIFSTMTNACPDRSVYGMYSTVQFETVLRRGFYMFSGLAIFLVTASIVKSGILLSFRNLSSTMKFEVNDALIKCLIASILLGHFFDITGGMFKVNNLLINMIKTDIQTTISVKDFDNQYIQDDGRHVNGRIEMNNLAQGLSEGAMLGGTDGEIVGSPVAKAAVSLASRGVAIWWEVFYLQRKLMISMLIILAPLWICCMFYPMLHGITFAAAKELWSQIIAQALHASLFWGYYHLIDNEMGWFQALVAMCLFIPISESIRFIFGATSGAGGKLATIGTLAGAGGIMNMTKAVASFGKGASNAVRAYNGLPTGSTSGHGGGMMSHAAGGVGNRSQSHGLTAGASEFSAAPVSLRQRKLRMAGEIGAGFGSSALRMGMTFAGAGLGPLGAHFGGEVGANIGDKVGYRAGVASLVGGEAAAKSAKEMGSSGIEGAKAFGSAVKNLPGNISSAYKGMSGREGDIPTRAARALGQGVNTSVAGAVGQYQEARAPSAAPSTSEEKEQQLAEQRENVADRWGARGEMIMGRGGFEAGAAYGRRLHSGRRLTQEGLNNLRDVHGHSQVYTVETNGASHLAVRDANSGEYKPISNLGRGNSALEKGQTVVTGYQVQGQGSAVRLVPLKEQVISSVPGSTTPNVEFQNQSYLYNETGKTAYTGKTVDPNQFVGPSRESSAVDLRRKNFKSRI